MCCVEKVRESGVVVCVNYQKSSTNSGSNSGKKEVTVEYRQKEQNRNPVFSGGDFSMLDVCSTQWMN